MPSRPSAFTFFACVCVAAICLLAVGCAAPTGASGAGTASPAGTAGKADRVAALSWSSAEALEVSGLPDARDGLLQLCDRGAETHTGEVLCYLFREGVRGSFGGVPDREGRPVDIEYVHFPAEVRERAALVIATGRTESFLKYAEVIYDLRALNRDLGYSIYVIDHRGQGLSDRLFPSSDDHDRGYVHEFADYVEDFKTFVDTVVEPSSHPAVFGLAHSMGGGIMTRYLQEHSADDAFDAVILSSPMHGIPQIDGVDGERKWVSRLLLRGFVWTRQGWRYVPDGSDWQDRAVAAEAWEPSTVTHSYERHMLTNYLFRTVPEIRLGSATARWVVESHNATLKMQDPELSQNVDEPVLLLQAEQEQIVSNAKQRAVCEGLPDCSLEVVDGARHEPMFETDDIRGPYMSRVVEYVEGHLR